MAQLAVGEHGGGRRQAAGHVLHRKDVVRPGVHEAAEAHGHFVQSLGGHDGRSRCVRVRVAQALAGLGAHRESVKRARSEAGPALHFGFKGILVNALTRHFPYKEWEWREQLREAQALGLLIG